MLQYPRRAPHGARGLKYVDISKELITNSRAPHGARGLKYSIINAITAISKSRPARGAWIEIVAKVNILIPSFSRAPHGARGLKFIPSFIRRIFGRSRPARGAWIEISRKKGTTSPALSRAPHGARGLKSRTWPRTSSAACRAPHGARGLKYGLLDLINGSVASRPARGAWIEIVPPTAKRWISRRRAPHGARGLKFYPCISSAILA